MGFPKGTILGKRKRDEYGRPLRKDGTLCAYRPNRGQFKKGHNAHPDTKFKKGMTPHNKGKRLEDYAPDYSIKKMAKTRFKKGQTPRSAHPKGKVVRWERTRNGRKEVNWIINIDWRGNRRPHNSYKWYLWEVDNQQDRPKGMIITTKNGNIDDIRLENLEVISRAENLARNRGRSL